MDIEFPRYERNDACRRIDVEFVARFAGSIPSREAVRAELALISGADPAVIALDRLRPRAKKGEVRGSGRIYDDLAAMKAGER
ncbi:MAG: small subunit ribosomal protein S24e [Methanofollis sp.]|nr:small subunit ribosomal protein S24e [Methanofollis sp.]